jgi:hypothetical protein
VVSWLLIAWVMAAQVGAAVVGWRLLIWLVRGHTRGGSRLAGLGGGEPIRTMSGAARHGPRADAVVPQSCLTQGQTGWSEANRGRHC